MDYSGLGVDYVDNSTLESNSADYLDFQSSSEVTVTNNHVKHGSATFSHNSRTTIKDNVADYSEVVTYVSGGTVQNNIADYELYVSQYAHSYDLNGPVAQGIVLENNTAQAGSILVTYTGNSTLVANNVADEIQVQGNANAACQTSNANCLGSALARDVVTGNVVGGDLKVKWSSSNVTLVNNVVADVMLRNVRNFTMSNVKNSAGEVDLYNRDNYVLNDTTSAAVCICGLWIASLGSHSLPRSQVCVTAAIAVAAEAATAPLSVASVPLSAASQSLPARPERPNLRGHRRRERLRHSIHPHRQRRNRPHRRQCCHLQHYRADCIQRRHCYSSERAHYLGHHRFICGPSCWPPPPAHDGT